VIQQGDLPVFLVCPTCRGNLVLSTGEITCERGHSFPATDNHINFLRNELFSDTEQSFTYNHELEVGGLIYRADNFILPYIDRNYANRSQVRFLDDGAGYGHTVARLAEAGVDAYGIDVGLRRKKWSELGLADRLYSADGRHLPIADETFDIVFSSGVLEHIADPLPPGSQRDAPTEQYIHEAIRVLRPGGSALIAHPNGRHPIDYWHGGSHGIRFHPKNELWMPGPSDLERWIQSSGRSTSTRFLPPVGFLRFERVRAHAYGRLLSGGMRALFELIRIVPALAGTSLNPWLITEIRRTK
jgi:SAM-dependent methyltransferase